MRRTTQGKRVLMTGRRKSGDADYQFTLYGNGASKFPPLIVKMSLHEMQRWLQQMQADPQAAAGEARPRLRIVG